MTTVAAKSRQSTFSTSALAAIALAGWGLGATAQTASVPETTFSVPSSSSPVQVAAATPVDAGFSPSSDSTDALPSAPTPQQAPQEGGLKASTPPAPPGEHPVAPLHAKYIPAGYRAQQQTAHDKVLVGLEDLYSIENFGAIVLSAGYEQLFNSQPNYGTDKGAFGERLGAAAIRETSQGVFSDVILAPLFHEDNRYYQKGPQYNPVKRTLYAVTRPLITRTDSGRPTGNASLLLGYAGAAALTPTYYPQINRNFHDTAATFGGSIGGAALGFFVDEFSSDVLIALHLKHQP